MRRRRWNSRCLQAHGQEQPTEHTQQHLQARTSRRTPKCEALNLPEERKPIKPLISHGIHRKVRSNWKQTFFLLATRKDILNRRRRDNPASLKEEGTWHRSKSEKTHTKLSWRGRETAYLLRWTQTGRWRSLKMNSRRINVLRSAYSKRMVPRMPFIKIMRSQARWSEKIHPELFARR